VASREIAIVASAMAVSRLLISVSALAFCTNTS